MSKTNNVRLIGYIGQTPKSVITESGKQVVSFSLATNDTYKDDDGHRQETTEWHNIVAFGQTAANIANYLSKGSRVMVLGKLRTRQYVDKQEVNRYTTEILVDDTLFLDKKDSK